MPGGSVALFLRSRRCRLKPQAKLAAQTAKDAAAKKKADDAAAFWAKVDADNKARSEQNAKDVAAFNSSQEAGRAADVQRQMEAQGWKRYSDVLYYQYAADSEFTCGHFRCTYIHVTTLTPNGCPGGIYVAASIEKGHASIEDNLKNERSVLDGCRDAIDKATSVLLD